MSAARFFWAEKRVNGPFFLKMGFIARFFLAKKTGYPANARVPRRSTLYGPPRCPVWVPLAW